MTIPVYVINLDHCRDRWKLISENLDRIGLKATRISAIDKAQLQDHPATRRLGVGHVACLQSHCKAMAALLDTDAPAALILEDDAELGHTVPDIIRDIDWWPDGHGVVKLDRRSFHAERTWLGRPVGQTPDGRVLRPLRRAHVRACGYLIDRFTAEEVVGIWADQFVPIDTLALPLDRLAIGARREATSGSALRDSAPAAGAGGLVHRHRSGPRQASVEAAQGDPVGTPVARALGRDDGSSVARGRTVSEQKRLTAAFGASRRPSGGNHGETDRH